SLDPVEREGILRELGNIARKYGERFGGGSLTASFKQHRETRWGKPLVHCRLRFNTPKGQFVGIGEGWGVEHAFQIALEHMERKLLRAKELENEPRFAEEYLRKAFELWI
ncbi:hypothetical protein DRO53_04970, partial [Candidatus Bathyarchaeota archaeon]